MSTGSPKYTPAEGSTCMEEVKEVIPMPSFDANKTQLPGSASKIQIEGDVVRELGEYVRSIAARYKDNPFHNCKCFFFSIGP